MTDFSEVCLLQVIGPHEVSMNTRELLGRAQAEKRLLENEGWRVVHLAVSEFPHSARKQQEHVAHMLQREGIAVELPAGNGPSGSNRLQSPAGQRRMSSTNALSERASPSSLRIVQMAGCHSMAALVATDRLYCKQ